MRRLGLLLLGTTLVSALLAGCGSGDEAVERELRAAIGRSLRSSHRYIYSESVGQEKTTVRGLVEDDFRFQAQVQINGVGVLEQVIRDDAAAVRMLASEGLLRFVEGGTAASLNVAGESRPAGVAGVPLTEALATNRWVLDPSGAPPLGLRQVERTPLGEDPVYDARTALEYALAAMEEGVFVVRFNPESLFYRASEDPFPRPRPRSGVVRYDVIPENLPLAGSGGPGGRDEQPSARHFRRLSFYVKAGRVIEVREQIAATGRLVDRMLRITRRSLEESDPALLEELDKAIAGKTQAEIGRILINGFNFLLQAQGDEPIRQRQVILQLLDFGERIQVDLPSADTIGGDLDGFENLGASTVETSGGGREAGQAGQPAQASTTTSVP